jgi:hypothetical protein
MQRNSIVFFTSLLALVHSQSWDFEDGNLPWGGGNGAYITDEDAHTGSRSMKIDGNKGGLGLYKGGGAPSNHWGRIWLKFRAASGFAHATFLAYSHPNRGEIRVVDTVYDPNQNQHQYLLNFPDDRNGGSSAYDYRMDEWKCYEWHIDGGSKRYEAWENGQPVHFINGQAEYEPNIPGHFGEMRVGMMIYQDGVHGTAFLDDLAIGTARLGCDIGPTPAPPPPGTVNEVINNAPGVGDWGGSCTCPDGQVYEVGATDSCATMHCEGGVTGTCNRHSGPWSKRAVVCATAAPAPAGPVTPAPTPAPTGPAAPAPAGTAAPAPVGPVAPAPVGPTAPAPAPAPAPESGACEDNHEDCAKMATDGQCRTNAAAMKTMCAKSCGECWSNLLSGADRKAGSLISSYAAAVVFAMFSLA